MISSLCDSWAERLRSKASSKREAYRSLWIQAHELLQCLGGCLKEVASHLVACVEMGKPPEMITTCVDLFKSLRLFSLWETTQNNNNNNKTTDLWYESFVAEVSSSIIYIAGAGSWALQAHSPGQYCNKHIMRNAGALNRKVRRAS